MAKCQTDSILTLNCLIVSKWVISFIWQSYHKLSKVCLLYRIYRPNKKNSQNLAFCSNLPGSFNKSFHQFKDLWIYPFIIIYLKITKTIHPINRKKLPMKFYATNTPVFWKMGILILLEIFLRILSKFFSPICCIMLFLLSRLNHVFIQEITIYNYPNNY